MTSTRIFNNGPPRVKDFHVGEENFTSLSFMPIPHSVQITLAALIFDGVLDRYPRLKFGAIELGASWIPSGMRFMDSAAAAFIKNEPRLQKLTLKPSEFVQRQVCAHGCACRRAILLRQLRRSHGRRLAQVYALMIALKSNYYH